MMRTTDSRIRTLYIEALRTTFNIVNSGNEHLNQNASLYLISTNVKPFGLVMMFDHLCHHLRYQW